MSKVIIEYKLKKYESAESSDPVSKIHSGIFDNLDNMFKFTMELKGGGWLILGRDAVQSCVFKVIG